MLNDEEKTTPKTAPVFDLNDLPRLRPNFLLTARGPAARTCGAGAGTSAGTRTCATAIWWSHGSGRRSH